MSESLDFSRAVVVVDDDPDVRATVRELLEMQGYTVLAVGNGHEALKLLSQRGAPGLILLDMRMPMMTGQQLLGLLQRHQALRDIPVVVVSANGEQTAPVGAQACLMKPFQVHELLDVVRQHCGAVRPHLG